MPPSHTHLPPSHAPLPNSNSQLPTNHTHLPSSHTPLPPSQAHLPPSHAPSSATTSRSNVSLDRSYDVIHPLDHSTEHLISPNTSNPSSSHAPYANMAGRPHQPPPQRPNNHHQQSQQQPRIQESPLDAGPSSYRAPNTNTPADTLALASRAYPDNSPGPVQEPTSRTAAAKLIYGVNSADHAPYSADHAPYSADHAPHSADHAPETTASNQPSSAYGAVLNTGFEAGSRTPLPSYSSFV